MDLSSCGERGLHRLVLLTTKTTALKQGNFDYLDKHERKFFDEPLRRITYSFNTVENTIVGHVEENGDLICLYEYRGKYYGAEFLISFSKNSASYKLIDTQEEDLPN